mgnify:CR=1 FL=1
MSNILLLEDDLSLINGLSFALKKQGFELAVARTLKEADSLWIDGKYDLLILDVSLPDGTGFEFCKKVRQVSKVPIIFLTAADEEVDIIMGLDIGGDDYITKPFKLGVLVSRVNALLRRAKDFSSTDTWLESNGMKVLLLQGQAFKNDRLLNNTLCYNLDTAGYAVDSALTKSAASNFLTKQDYDLIVLDVNLPDGNGFDFCREVKERRPDTAVIFLTANDMESDMLKGYELGAEDYVTKPFPMSVFQKKLSVVLGRLAKQSGGDCYEDGALSINFSEMTASLSGKPLVFTPLEYRLLKILTKNPQNVLTRQVLLEKLWDADGNFVDEHALTAAISRVRNKIETEGCQYIKTVYGMGYMWIGGASK